MGRYQLGRLYVNNHSAGPYSFENGTNEEGLPWKDSKYYDLYDYNASIEQYQRGILGDATKELGPFYTVKYSKTNGTGSLRYISSHNTDLSQFVCSEYPWFARGGSRRVGSDAGIFTFIDTDASGGPDFSFRAVLTL